MKKILLKITKLNRKSKQFILIVVDSIAIFFALVFSFSLRLDEIFWPSGELFWLIIASPLIAIPIFYSFGMYQSIIRFIGLDAFWNTIKAVSSYSFAFGALVYLTSIYGIPRSVVIINWGISLILINALRFFARWVLKDAHSNNKNLKKIKVLIYGAGSAGVQLLLALKHSDEYDPIAFIDDQKDLQGRSINGIKVYSPENLDSLIDFHSIKEVLLALPSISRSRRKDIINSIDSMKVTVKSLPGMSQIAQGEIKVEDLRDINIDDLLGRDSVPANKTLLKKNIFNKVVLVTGAGGSIGSELCRQVAALSPSKLILFEISEPSLYAINNELLEFNNKIKIIPILGSVTNKKRVTQVLKYLNVETIYHSAAYKHVPMVELNTIEGINNNVFGTLNMVRCSVVAKVETFVLISTDKAVRPTNTMGTSKRIAEMILQAMSKSKQETRFIIVRFGNVLGSSGSVIPLFSKQIETGGPVTVTDKEMFRYFMTIPEAVELVIQAGAMGSEGDVFVLDMGLPVSIKKLAEKMINLSGLEIKDKDNPNGDIEIQYTGLRPGEKLFEELLIGNNTSSTENQMILRAKEEMIEWKKLEQMLLKLEDAIQIENYEKIRNLLMGIVPQFKPQCEISDIIYEEKINL
tara:strand:+ start:3740 stop:5641 length:1902 start_codon:yes stop_codon:yes gene_type:complete